MARLVVVKLPDDVYERLSQKAREEGFTLVSDYVKHLIYRALGEGQASVRSLEERLERIESGELPPRLYERIWSIVKSVLQEEGVSSINVDKIVARIERRLMDLINPWTAKVDKLAQQVAEVLERLEALEESVKRFNEELEKLKEQSAAEKHVETREREYEHPTTYRKRHVHVIESGHGALRRRRSAIEWLRERKVLFESELTRLRDRDAFFEKLRREGAVIIELPGERVAVDPEYWREFKERVERLSTPKEEEIQVLLRDPTMFKLFQKLKDEGLVYFDMTSGTWRVSKELP